MGIYRPLQFASIIAYHKEDQHVLWSTSNKHPVDLCMIIMLFLICPYSSTTDPGVRQLQELHAGGEVGGEEGDISRGIMLESSQYPRPVCDSVTQDCWQHMINKHSSSQPSCGQNMQTFQQSWKQNIEFLKSLNCAAILKVKVSTLKVSWM